MTAPTPPGPRLSPSPSPSPSPTTPLDPVLTRHLHELRDWLATWWPAVVIAAVLVLIVVFYVTSAVWTRRAHRASGFASPAQTERTLGPTRLVANAAVLRPDLYPDDPTPRPGQQLPDRALIAGLVDDRAQQGLVDDRAQPDEHHEDEQHDDRTAWSGRSEDVRR